MRILEVNCRNCPHRVVSYRGIEIGHSHSCHKNKLRRLIGFGAAYNLPVEPPEFCPLEKAKRW